MKTEARSIPFLQATLKSRTKKTKMHFHQLPITIGLALILGLAKQGQVRCSSFQHRDAHHHIDRCLPRPQAVPLRDPVTRMTMNDDNDGVRQVRTKPSTRFGFTSIGRSGGESSVQPLY